jgi:hypothetical protein
MAEASPNVWFLIAGMYFIALGAWLGGNPKSGPHLSREAAILFSAAFVIKGVMLVTWGARVLPLPAFLTGAVLVVILIPAAILVDRGARVGAERVAAADTQPD